MLDFNQEIILEDSKVILRPLVANDIDALKVIAFEDKMLLQYSPNLIYNADLLEKYIKDALDSKAMQSRYPFVIIDKYSNTVVGSTSFCNVSNYDKRLEIGYTWLGNAYQKTGINRHCKYLMLDYCFNVLNFERVEFKTDERNEKSRNALLGIGAKEEGILKSHTLMYDGYRRNTVYYAILQHEFANTKLYNWYKSL
ncbi:MAG: GNAT family N-acetyltransferase [Sphingobacteriales bacterium]|nr:MAG: GNAT family N-acetyltransferase [Sphingobacteriales bacterium]